MSIEFMIAYMSFGSVGIPLTVALLHGKTSWSRQKPLFLILVGSLLTDSVCMVLLRYSLNTYLLLNGYLIFQASLLIWLYSGELQIPFVRNIVLVLFLVFSGINIAFVQGPWIFNSTTNVLACLILIVLPLVYFYRLLNELPIVHVHQLPLFWISFGVITYYAGNFFLFLVKNYLIFGESGSHRYMWILHNLLNVIKNLLFAIGLWQSYRKAKSLISSS